MICNVRYTNNRIQYYNILLKLHYFIRPEAHFCLKLIFPVLRFLICLKHYFHNHNQKQKALVTKQTFNFVTFSNVIQEQMWLKICKNSRTPSLNPKFIGSYENCVFILMTEPK